MVLSPKDLLCPQALLKPPPNIVGQLPRRDKCDSHDISIQIIARGPEPQGFPWSPGIPEQPPRSGDSLNAGLCPIREFTGTANGPSNACSLHIHREVRSR